MKKSNYSDRNIETKTGLLHIRHRPGMYGCDPFTQQGIYLLVKEIIDNSVDESRMDMDHKHTIDICFIRMLRGFQVVVKDQGRGVPLNKLEPVFTTPGTSGKWGEGYIASGGTHGVGAKATVAMSKLFCAISSRPEEGRSLITVEDANVVNHKVIKSKKMKQQGTVVFFEPDTRLLPNVKEFFEDGCAYEELLGLMEFISVFVPNTLFRISEGIEPIPHKIFYKSPDEVFEYLNKIETKNTFITSNDINPDEYLLKKYGIRPSIVWSSGTLKQDVIDVPAFEFTTNGNEKTTKKMSYELRFFLTNDFSLRSANVLGAVNMININDRKSVHIDVPYSVLKEFLVENISDSKYVEFFMDSYNLPIHLISIVNWQHATFTGQHKHRFTNSDFAKGFEKSIRSKFKELGKEYWSNLYELIQEDIREKYERKNKLDLNLNKSDKNLAFKLSNIGCFYDCRTSDRSLAELIICEGVSSGDYVTSLRQSEFQAVFELKGKPINALQSEFKTSLKNKIYSDLIRVLGTSPSDTELKDLRYDKIILLSDPDPK